MTANRSENRDQRASRPGYLGFKVIGTYKLISGLVALAAAIWSVYFLGHDPERGLVRIILQLGLDPQNEVIHPVIAAVTAAVRMRAPPTPFGAWSNIVPRSSSRSRVPPVNVKMVLAPSRVSACGARR